MIGAALDLAKPSHLASQLSLWFLKNRRPLPWRADRDPYRIWVSEVMLQQTTVVAVIPYYENFLRKFPTLRHLAKAPLEQVLEAWSGLGYYSRARRLKEAAVALNQMGGFPQTSAQLAKLPGFGPYTSRAVSSLAFGEKVGVVDGNVIRVLTRLMGFQGEWWSAAAARHLQALADKLSEKSDPYVYNQAVMELGATVCTPQNPSCSVCPVAARCVARTQNLTPPDSRPTASA